MPIDENSPLWALLADWVKLLLIRPDPPPDQLVGVSEMVILTTISALSQRLSEETGSQLRGAVNAAIQRAAARGAAAAR
ncbi:MAG TPA: hypothetical protein VI455_14050 [Terriglobia bacterium]